MPADHYKEPSSLHLDATRPRFAPTLAIKHPAARPLEDHYRFVCGGTADFAPQSRLDASSDSAFCLAGLVDFDDDQQLFHGRVTWLNGDGGKFCSYAGSARRILARPARGEWTVLMLRAPHPVQSRIGGDFLPNAMDTAAIMLTSGLQRCRSDQVDMHLLFPRAAVEHALGVDPEQFCFARLLDENALAPFVRSQMILLDQLAGSLKQYELANMLDITITMGLMLLHSVAKHDGSDTHIAMFAAARQLIDAHAHQPDFNANSLARALGCSRAKLYRVFKSQNTTVNSVLREVRLLRARKLIEASGTDINIGALAYSCGFGDHSSFGKMFRKRYGASPGKWRLRPKDGQPF